MGPLCPCPNSKKPMKKVPGTPAGASHGGGGTPIHLPEFKLLKNISIWMIPTLLPQL
ncbi:unnamed protein product [Staurois parvus]|uniref:Uncharacterized protein n=1 Tax=Staurois parvus TaxID=386267 RepID=A0ABN9GAU2_9NEOB|nr:unnamed protein product [Staurois parvus]